MLAMESTRLTVKQDKAVLLHVRGCLQREIAAELGVSLRTVQNWMQLPEFQERLRISRDSLWTETLDLLIASSKDSVKALAGCLEDENPYVRISAARTLIQHGRYAAENKKLLVKIEELERLVESMRH